MTEMSICRIRPEGPEGKGLEHIGYSVPDKIVDGDPIESGYTFYTDESGLFTTGVWASAPGTLRMDGYPVDEYCHIISGRVVITDSEGHTETFVPGESFVIPKGFHGTWHMPEAVRKFYVTYGTGAAEQTGE